MITIPWSTLWDYRRIQMNFLNEKATIMIIDDTPANLRLLQELLQNMGHRVVAFPRGSMALKAAHRNPPDLVLLDIRMPEMDGFEVCRQLKQNSLLKQIPVLFISALNQATDKIAAFSVGAVDYVTKPFQPEEVYARVETHLRLRRTQKELEHQKVHLESLVQQQVKEISDSQLATIHALSELVESRDVETGGHIERTRHTCRILAERMVQYNGHIYDDGPEPDDNYISNLFHASPLHDIGKIGIPDTILLKQGPLSRDEFETMKTHTVLGADTLRKTLDRYSQNSFLRMGLDIARSHHERWDGGGYPDGLAENAIPLSARIMAVADVYDALRSARPYKTSFSHHESVRIMVEDSAGHFDPRIITVFSEIESKLAELYTNNCNGEHTQS
jgi:putative two-component system response regulator